MKCLIAVCLFGFSVLITAATANKLVTPYYDLKDAEKLFEKFEKDYNRIYKDEADRQVHFEAFKNNLKEINKQNKGQPYAVADINKFADYTPKELDNLYGVVIPKN